MAANHVPYNPYPTAEPAGGNPHAYENIPNATPSAFGANIGQAIEKGGNEFENLALKQAEMDNERYASDNVVAASREMNQAWGDYAKNRGASAINALPGFYDKLDQIKQRYVSAAPNEQAQRNIDRLLSNQHERHQIYGQRYADSQRQVWEDHTTNDFAEQKINDALLGITTKDANGIPAQSELDVAAGAKTIADSYEAHGMNVDLNGSRNTSISDRKVAEFYGKAYKTLIEDRVASGDLPMAIKLFERNAAKMSPESQVAVERGLSKKVDEYNTKTISDAFWNDFMGHPNGGGATAEELSKRLESEGKFLKLPPLKLPPQRPLGPEAPAKTFAGAETGLEAAQKLGLEPSFNQGRSLGLRGGLSTITTNSGAKITVASETLPQWQGFLNDLEARGYYIDPKQSGGYNNRSQLGGYPSQHAIGNAIDINWTNNPQGSAKNDLPPDIGKLADKWGISWGGYIKHPTTDAMHFEVSRKVDTSKIFPEAAGGTTWAANQRQPVTAFHSRVNDAINKAADKYGLDPQMLGSFATIESSGLAGKQTGDHKGLFQLTDEEFRKHGGAGEIFDPYANADAAARKLKAESAYFQQKYGRSPTALDLYMVHQQGEGGYDAHASNPDAPAWRNMASTTEGQQKGDEWAKRAIWGNIPSDVKKRFPGGVDSVTSRDFFDIWQGRLNELSGAPVRTAQAQTGVATDAGYGSPRTTEEPPLTKDDLTGSTPQTTSLLERAAKATVGFPDLQSKVVRELKRREGLFRVEHESEMNAISEGVPNMVKALKEGADFDAITPYFPAIKEDRIRMLFQPKQADKMISELHFAREMGAELKSIQFMSEADLVKKHEEMATGLGALSEKLKAHKGRETTGAGTTGAEPEITEETATDFRHRAELLAAVEKGIAERYKALNGPDADPAAYAKTAPTVAAAWKDFEAAHKAMEGTPLGGPQHQAALAAWSRYTDKSIAMQKSLGAQDVHILTRGTAESMTAALTSPGADARGMMDGWAREYGPRWETMAKDLVSLGGLPVGYQALRVLDQKDAAQLGSFYQNFVNPAKNKEAGASGKLSPEKLVEQALPDKTISDIKASIRGSNDVRNLLNAYDRMHPNGEAAAPFRAGLQQSIEYLAIAKAMKGEAAGTAANNAIDAFTKKHAFLDASLGQAMVPADRIDDTMHNMRATVDGLSVDNITPPRLFENIGVRVPYNEKGEHVTVEQSRWVGTATAKRWLEQLKAAPCWVNSPDGKGLYLTDAHITGGMGRVVLDKSGKPVMVKFSDPRSTEYSPSVATEGNFQPGP